MSGRNLVVVAVALSAGGPAFAQIPAAIRPGWLPRQVSLGGYVSVAQRAPVIARLEQFERMLARIPELAHPDGFEILPVYGGGGRMSGPNDADFPNSVVSYSLALMFYAPSKAIAGEGSGCIRVVVNDGPPVGPQTLRSADGADVYIEPERGPPIARATQVYGELLNRPHERSGVSVLFTQPGELPWKSVSREAFYDAVLLDVEGKQGSKLSEMRAAFGKTPYQEWMETAAERKKHRETTIMEASKYQSAAEVEKFRRMLEETERDVTARLKASEDFDRARTKSALTEVTALGDGMRAELARMSAAERRMPAYINNALTEGPNATGWRMTDSDASPAWRVLTPDYDFWRARRSPIEVRSITVGIAMTQTCLRPKVQQALWRVFQAMDWAAFARQLDAPR